MGVHFHYLSTFHCVPSNRELESLVIAACSHHCVNEQIASRVEDFLASLDKRFWEIQKWDSNVEVHFLICFALLAFRFLTSKRVLTAEVIY